MQNSYQVINASAGSGKTYALVQRLLMICLRYPHQHHVIGNILALTFTNKAANEMKERILAWLGKFTQPNYEQNGDLINLQHALKEQGIHVDLHELHVRSKNLLDYILHNYSILNISTIDKFNSRLVRNFSYELGLAKNFNLEIDAEPFLMEAVDKILDEIEEDSPFAATFLDFVNYNLDNNEKVNLNQSLYKSAKEYIKDIHYHQLKENEGFDEDHYEKIKSELRDNIRALKKDAHNSVIESLQLIKSNDIDIEHFAQGARSGLGAFFVNALNFYDNKRDEFPFPSNEENAIKNYLKGASSKGKDKEAEILHLLPTLLSNRESIIKKYIETVKKERILAALLPLKVNKDIQDELKKIEEENDLVLLSKFNILINENLRNEPSAFIYEKVGTKFSHYFFDEFQDTSELQWQNFIPLRDHALASDNTSFTLVGDPKQSIYRFRGGESKLMLDILNGHEEAYRKAEVIELKDNWRSAKNIVTFNNELYQFLAQDLKEEHQYIFDQSATQHPKSSIEGRVKISLIENQKKEHFFEDSCSRMQKDIQECIDYGFSLSDITILCRGNKDILEFSQRLNNLEIEYKGIRTNIKTISESGLTLNLSSTLLATLSFLRWRTNTKNTPHLITMMYHLKELGRIKVEDFTQEMASILDLADDEKILQHLYTTYDLQLSREEFPTFNLYNTVEYFVNEFSVDGKETDFLLNFLETVYNFTQTTGVGIKDLIKFWDEDASKKSIQASDNIDAVQIMTIHKAKGLEFPIVFIPMQNSSKDNEFTSWFSTSNTDVLKSVNIKNFSKALEVYDEEIHNFNTENAYQNFLDNLCIQYVATTRPVEQLFLYLQKESKSSNHLRILDFVRNYNANDDEFDIFEVNRMILQKQKHQEQPHINSKEVTEFKNHKKEEYYIKIATPSKNYQQRVEKVKNGIFVHELLAKIKTTKDIAHTIEKYLIDGLITRQQSTEIFARIMEIVDKYPQYFSEDWHVINEKDIMISENGISKQYRPDRILEKDHQHIIIDFKTGEEQPEHQKQLELYQTILEKLGKPVIKTEIIYI